MLTTHNPSQTHHGPNAVVAHLLSHLSVRDLIAELARVEEALRSVPALLARADGFIHHPARVPLVRHEHAILTELAARRRARRTLPDDAATEQERGDSPPRTSPPWR